MELYTLDSSFRRIAVVDRYESLIWTERYAEAGDFNLVIEATDDARSTLVKGTRLALNRSDRVMTIEEVESKDDSEGRLLLTVKGPSLESAMDQRSTRGAPGSPLTTWTITDTPTNIARQIFTATCGVNSQGIAADSFPFYTTGSLYPAGTNAEPTVTGAFTVPTDTVYNVIKNLADIYGFGFRLYRGPDTSKIYFDIYTGSDRTTAQTSLKSVIFSKNYGTLDEVSELNSITDWKNVAYVYSDNGATVVTTPGFENVTGFDRRVLIVDAQVDPSLTGSALYNALQLLGQQELAKHQQLQAIDGQAPQLSLFKYGVDYQLGDLVEMRNEQGDTQNMRVTEQIFVQDEQGERDYPTLQADTFITPNSWAAWDSNTQWADEPDTLTWSTVNT